MEDTQAVRKWNRDGRNIHSASYDGIALLYFSLHHHAHSHAHTHVLTHTDTQPSNPVLTQACQAECHHKPGRSGMQLLSAYTHTHTTNKCV